MVSEACDEGREKIICQFGIFMAIFRGAPTTDDSGHLRVVRGVSDTLPWEEPQNERREKQAYSGVNQRKHVRQPEVIFRTDAGSDDRGPSRCRERLARNRGRSPAGND